LRKRLPPRPARGTPEETRERLVAAARIVFNEEGYFGTDSNALARAAGYAPGTFYKHFEDKRDIFLAVYAAWAKEEWEAVDAIRRSASSPRDYARRVVLTVQGHHTKWRGFRASLRALVAHDPVVRRFHRKQRKAQLEMMAAMRAGSGRARAPEEDLVLLLTLERTFDALADGEVDDLGLSAPDVRALLEDLVHASIS
jgi:AcrR family transcriptional regulator